MSRGSLQGLLAFTAVAVFVFLVARVPTAAAAPSVNCTGMNPGANGVLDVVISGTSSNTDSLTISESGGAYSVGLDSGGSTAVCTGTTYPDSGGSGFPTVEVTGSTLLATDFQASSSDAGLTFEGQAGATNTLDLGSLPSTGVTVSVPAQKVTWSGGNDFFSGISIVRGSFGGNTDFLTGNAGGYELDAIGSGNALDLSGAAADVTASMAAGTVTGLQGSGPTSGVDAFSGISSFIGSTSGSTTVVADSAEGLSFVGKGSANVLDFSNVPVSQLTPLQVNVSGAPVNSLANDNAAVGSTTFSFSNVAIFAGSSDGQTTFFAGSSGGFTFNAAGGTAGNVLDLGAANSGLNVQVPTGTVNQLTTGTDNFSNIQTFNGPSGGNAIFDAGATDNETFNLPGNGNKFYGANGSVSVNGSGNGNDFVAGSSNETFSDSGSGNTLDFYEAAASPANPLIVNLSGTQVGGVSNNTASNGSATYSFGGIEKFAGSNNGNTDFIASGTTGGYTFDSNGGNDTLDLSFWSFYAPGTDVRVPDGVAHQGVSLVDFFVGITTFDGPASGNTNFDADSTGGYTFNGSGSGNVLDLTNAGSGVAASVAGGTVSLASGIDKYSGIAGFIGSSAGDTTLDFSGVPTSAGTSLNVNVSGATVNSIPDDTAAVGATTLGFENISSFTGSSSGHTAFFAGGSGGFTFNGGGTAGNSLDLSAANSGLFVVVPLNKVAGLTSGSDKFADIQDFIGSSAGGTTFTGGTESGHTFTALGNNNTFAADDGSATFDGGSGSGNELDFSSVSATTQSPLIVNLSGTTVGSTANDTATVGTSTTYAFSDIGSFVGASPGNTRFVASPSTGGFSFGFQGTGNTLDASFFPGSGTTLSVPQETLTQGGVQDTFTPSPSGFVNLVGSSAGTTTFVAGSSSGFGFTGQGSGNTLDLTDAGSNVTASVPSGTINLGSGTDQFSGISSFIGSSDGGTDFVLGTAAGKTFQGLGNGNTLDLGAAGPGVSVSVPNGTASLASGSDSFSGITTFKGSSSGGNIFVADDTGGFTFDGGGSDNVLDLSAVPEATVTVNGDSLADPGIVSGLINFTDSFSDIQSFQGQATVLYRLSVGKLGGGAGRVTSSPGGIDCGSTCSHDFASGAGVTLTATPAAGSQFTGWSGACSGTGSCSVPMTSTTAVSATFELQSSHTLSVAKSGNGTGIVRSSPAGIDCGSACSHNFASGTTVVLTPVAAAGSMFAGWSGACTGTGACTVTMNQARSAAATFNLASEPLTVTKTGDGAGAGHVTSSPAGIDCGSTCSHDFAYGTLVTLTAIGPLHDIFQGWSGGGCSGTRACTVTMNSAMSVTADFELHLPMPRCVVPNVRSKSLKAAKAAIRAQGCRVGTIKHSFSKRVKKGHVISERPRPHKQLALHTKVSLVVSLGRHP